MPCSALDEAGGADGIASCGMREADAQLGEALPQFAFVVGAVLPSRFQHLMRCEGSALPDKFLGQSQGFVRRQGDVGHRLDARRTVRKGTPQGVARSSLLSPPLLIPVSLLSGNHLLTCPPARTNARAEHLAPTDVARLTGGPTERLELPALGSTAPARVPRGDRHLEERSDSSEKNGRLFQ
ncbi:MAG: hypothetical protein JWR27_963 [Aeromicrobium sp.]|jgi:hypothetical protein|nr:hypothetical protein [Aeromicrobium sp.]